jgi:Fic family protein
MEEIAKALELKNELDTLRPIDKEKEAIIMQKFRLDWNYHSNHLEGNSLTYGETKALILFGITAQGKPLKDTLEITGHNEAINWVIDLIKGERSLTENFIRELHSLLLQDSYKESKNADGVLVPRKISAGKYKTTTNHVETATGEIFYFATPEETPAKMFDLLNWYNQKTKEKDVNPILVAAKFHYRFIRIHPFDDGNGRTARILMNFILMQFGFPPVIIKTEDKANYFAALQMADVGNIETFVHYIAQNLVRSLEIMIAGAKGESIEEDDDLEKEIALLEQKLKIIESTKVLKSHKSSAELFQNSILPFIHTYIENMSKFEKLYSNCEFEIFGDNFDFLTKEDFLQAFKGKEVDNLILNKIKIHYIFSMLKQTGFEDVKYENYISIIFDANSCKINSISDRITWWEVLYDSILTKTEIGEIVKSEVNRHKEFIEQKIAEKENKSS